MVSNHPGSGAPGLQCHGARVGVRNLPLAPKNVDFQPIRPRHPTDLPARCPTRRASCGDDPNQSVENNNPEQQCGIMDNVAVRDQKACVPWSLSSILSAALSDHSRINQDSGQSIPGDAGVARLTTAQWTTQVYERPNRGVPTAAALLPCCLQSYRASGCGAANLFFLVAARRSAIILVGLLRKQNAHR